MKRKPVLESQESTKNNKTLKIGEKIFFGVDRGPPKPLFWRFWGPPTTPKKYFFTNFQRLIIFSGFLGFQNRFSFHFIITVTLIMIFLRNFRFFAQNLGILHSKICPKSAKL